MSKQEKPMHCKQRAEAIVLSIMSIIKDFHGVIKIYSKYKNK